MTGRQKTKIQAENAVAQKLRPLLGEYLRAIRKTDRLIYDLLATREGEAKNDRAAIVCAILLARLSNDLRGCGLLASRGHVLQSWTLGASGLESAYSVGFVGTSEERAKKWFAHKDLAKAPWPAYDALQATLRTFGLSHNLESFFGSYRRLSAAKHGNPLIQSRYGVSISPAAARIQVDPYFGAGVARAARFGIIWTLHGAGLGLWSYTHNFAVGNKLEKRVVRFAQSTTALLSRARQIDASALAT